MRDVGMVERRQNFGFPLKSKPAVRILSEGLRQHFQRHVALQLGVAGAVHLAHAARADGREDFIGAESVTYREGHGYWNNSNPQA